MSLYPGFADAVEFLHPGALRNGQVVVRDDGGGAYLDQWNLPGSPPTDAEVDAAVAQIPAAKIAAAKLLAKALLDDDNEGRDFRAFVSLIVSELNLLRAWITAFKAATAAASSLANLQTRVAALDAMPARTGAQVKQAIKDAIDAE